LTFSVSPVKSRSVSSRLRDNLIRPTTLTKFLRLRLKDEGIISKLVIKTIEIILE